MGIVRLAKFEDSKRVWEIRNHPQNRRNFHHPDEVPWLEHEKWFASQYLSSEENKCFVLEDEGLVMGYCRFDKKPEGHLVSIAIDPSAQGRGLGSVLLEEALKNFRAGTPIFAEIKISNQPSLKLFQKKGFVIYKKDENYYYLKYET